MASIQDELQELNSLKKQKVKGLNFIDVFYEGYDRNTPEYPLVLEGYSSIVSKIKFWLFSSKGDYVRKPGMGGVIVPYIGKKMTQELVDEIKSKIENDFKPQFYGIIDLVNLDVVPDFLSRRIVIRMIIRNVETNEYIPIQVGAVV